MKKTFLLCADWEEHLALLTEEQRGRLLSAIFAYNNRRELPDLDPATSMAFSFMRRFFDEKASNYAQKVQANKGNGKLGGRPKNPDGFPKTQRNPKNPDGFPKTQEKPNNHDTDTETETDTETDTETETVPPSEGVLRGASRRFIPPTLAEVSAYVSERHSPVDPQGFIDFYAAKGWMVGKTPMKDWKAACRNAEMWERWGKPAPPNRRGTPQVLQDDLDALFAREVAPDGT